MDENKEIQGGVMSDSDLSIVDEKIKDEQIQENDRQGLEDKQNEPQKIKTKKKMKKWQIVLLIILILILSIYFAGTYIFSNHIFPNTYLNGINVEFKTEEEVNQLLQNKINRYEIEILTRDKKTEILKGNDFGMTYESCAALKDIISSQNEFTWPVKFFESRYITTKTKYSYDKEKLKKSIGKLACMQEENQIAPVDATLKIEKNKVEIVEEDIGKTIEADKINSVVEQTCNLLWTDIDLDKSKVYQEPVYTSESEKILSTKAELEKYLSTVVSYKADDLETVLDKNTTSQWLSVDENIDIIFDNEAMSKYTDDIVKKYNVADSDEELISPDGKKVIIPKMRKGRKVNKDEELKQLLADIKTGERIERLPVLSVKGTPAGKKEWGDTYIEVDIGNQKMWYIKNGNVVFKSDIVTGSPGRDTPTGVYQLLEKMRNKTLRGDVQPDGSWGYQTPVAYWMRVTWSGIGFHDATWQAKFGGQRYVQGYGSHGCINMPLGKAKELYSLIDIHERIIIHK